MLKQAGHSIFNFGDVSRALNNLYNARARHGQHSMHAAAASWIHPMPSTVQMKWLNYDVGCVKRPVSGIVIAVGIHIKAWQFSCSTHTW